ncbi:uncharacterized protein LOC141629250 [Silene latifolia]|uniref:uncharacterized protein LOC141629250 n=1 Tax=Silene latifolia TaxID=37657 RepID=UPI003D78A2A5
MLPRIRKFDSGSEKRKKKKRIEELVQSQKGALDKFFTKGSTSNSENITDNEGVVATETAVMCDNPVFIDFDMPIKNNDDKIDDEDNNNDDNLDMNENDSVENNEGFDVGGEKIDVENGSHMNNTFDMFDPRNWDSLNSDMIKILAKSGPKRDLTIEKGRKGQSGRRFKSTCYTRVLPNGERCDRDWLFYSKELDKVFCFCCKIFRKANPKSQLANDGLSDWSHICVRLKQHEMGIEHIVNMTAWYDLRERIEKSQTIDKKTNSALNKEKEHWKKVLERIIFVVVYLATHNLAFRGSNGKLYQKSNGNFLGLIEMLARFDPIIQEHVHRITNDTIHSHYLGHNIQNELILLVASAIKSEIIKSVKEAKYFSVILDCTPDVSHQDQMSLILRYVDVSSSCVCIKESFLGFLSVNDTTGQGLFDVLLNELKSLDLDVNDVRGQSYDNGSNMKGKNQGVQKRLLDVNPRAFFTPCASHSLNLTLCDMANSCGKAKDFFGVIQRIYTIFANSNKIWEILKNNATKYTIKQFSSTRWESRVDSVKAIRFQIAEVCDALLQVGETDNDSKIRSEAKSLAMNELGDFEFLVALVIWYEILYRINFVSKQLQSKNMILDVEIDDIKKLVLFFEDYRESGFNDAVNIAREIALELNVDPVFPKKRVIRRKKQFDENQNDTSK